MMSQIEEEEKLPHQESEIHFIQVANINQEPIIDYSDIALIR